MDLWPELIVNSFSLIYRPLVNLFCAPIYFIRKMVFDNCVGFISLAKKYLDIPISISNNILQKPHAVIYNGIDVDVFRAQMGIVDSNIDTKLGKKNENEIWFIFAGTLGPSYDIKTILEGFLNLNNNLCKLIIAGDGSERSYVETFIKNNKLDHVKYIGKISKNSLPYLYSKCDVGLNSYGVFSNVEMSDKFYDYTAAGLVVLNSLKGEVMDYVDKYNIGYNYQASNLESFMNKLQLILKAENVNLIKKKSFELGTSFDQKIQLNKFLKFSKLINNSLNL
jgi:glycosyltransferase involved in cell wall biosynthesis